MKITKTHITLKLMKSITPGEQCRYCDTEVIGLQVWVGSKTVSYYIRKRSNGKEYTIKLGNWPDITIEEARQKALDRLGALSNHGSIDAPSGRANPLVGDAIRYYISIQADENKKKKAEYALEPFRHLEDRRICDIKLEDVESIHKKMKNTPGKANLSVKLFAAALHLICKKLGKPYYSPATGIEWYKMNPRTRYLTKDEAKEFFATIEELKQSNDFVLMADVIYMLLYTGQRKANVCEMMLEEIDSNGKWTIPKEKFKTSVESSVQLGEVELSIIEKYRNGRTSGYVFPHKCSLFSRLRRALKKVCDKSGITNFCVHDLRRTIGTWMLSNGVPIEIVSKKLCHSSIAVTQEVYAHLMPDASVKSTYDAIDSIINSK